MMWISIVTAIAMSFVAQPQQQEQQGFEIVEVAPGQQKGAKAASSQQRRRPVAAYSGKPRKLKTPKAKHRGVPKFKAPKH